MRYSFSRIGEFLRSVAVAQVSNCRLYFAHRTRYLKAALLPTHLCPTIFSTSNSSDSGFHVKESGKTILSGEVVSVSYFFRCCTLMIGDPG